MLANFSQRLAIDDAAHIPRMNRAPARLGYESRKYSEYPGTSRASYRYEVMSCVTQNA